MLNTLLVYKSILVEIVLTNIPANGQQIAFQDVPQLRGKIIQGVESFDRNGVSVSPTGATVVSSTRGIAVTFAINSDERFFQWPVFSLTASQNGGLIRELANVSINLPKSYITILDSTTVAQNEAALFNFYYRDRVK